MRLSSRPGMKLPLFAAALAKIFLAALDDEEAGAVLDGVQLPRFSDRSVTDTEELLREVELERTRDYALDDEEYFRGARAGPNPWRSSGSPGFHPG